MNVMPYNFIIINDYKSYSIDVNNISFYLCIT